MTCLNVRLFLSPKIKGKQDSRDRTKKMIRINGFARKKNREVYTMMAELKKKMNKSL